MLQTGGLSLFQPHSSCALDKKKTASYAGYAFRPFAHPNRLGTSQVTPDTILIAIQFFTVFSVSSLHPARSRKVGQPGEERNRGIKVL